jgi:hypothetical protein
MKIVGLLRGRFPIRKTYFISWNRGDALNLHRSCEDLIKGRGFFDHLFIWRSDMPKAVRISSPIRTTVASSEKSDNSPLISIALFCGIGLLVSLVAVLMGVPGVWE